MEENRIPLVLWSGGLDSTFLMLHELIDHDVDTLEVEFGNLYPEHKEAEAAARDVLVEEFQKLHQIGQLKGVIRRRLKVKFKYPVSEFTSDNVSIFGQQPAWLFCAYINHEVNMHSCVMTGMILSDSISMSADSLKVVWDALREISPTLSQKRYYGRNKVTTLEFPLLYGCVDKYNVWRGFGLQERYHDTWKKLRKMTWCCYRPSLSQDVGEDSISSYTPCGKCLSCIAEKEAITSIR